MKYEIEHKVVGPNFQSPNVLKCFLTDRCGSPDRGHREETQPLPCHECWSSDLGGHGRYYDATFRCRRRGVKGGKTDQ